MKTKIDCGCEKDVFACQEHAHPKPAAHAPTIEPISLEANAFARAILTKEKLAKGEWIHGDEFERQVNLLAAFIVRAVNAHEMLLTSLVALENVFALRAMRTGCNKAEETVIKEVRRVIAIAKAEGK